MRRTLALVRGTPGCLLLLFGNFAITFGTNLVLPYLAVYLSAERGTSAWAIAAAFTAKLWAQQGLMALGGSIGDRIGTVRTMCLGLLLRALSYVLVVTAVSDVGAVIACGLLGVGSALYIPAGKAALARLVDGQAEMTAVFALRSTANNAGTALGPLAGGLLLFLAAPEATLLVAAGLFLALLPPLWQLRHRIPHTVPQPAAVARGGMLSILRSHPRMRWIVLTAVTFGFCYVQIEYAMPITAAAEQGKSFVGVLYTVNAVAVVVLQLLLSARLGRLVNAAAVIAGGLGAMAVGFGVFGRGSAGFLVLGVVLFTVGEVVVDPRLDSEVARTVPVAQHATAFGLVGFGVAVGGTLANVGASSALGPARLGDRYWLLLLGTVAALAVTTRVCAPRVRRSAVTERSPTPVEAAAN
ncbi:MFS transporter [Krasilnikovia sp. MM14-A1004]|uniref:MFS transporter n=1 Tax=Krasilnikovia sp. MM14-A1004 TaxID=3373541 RepID=UPI00399C661D